MGSYLNTYIGVYLSIDKVNFPKEELIKIENVFTCENTSCKTHGVKAIGKFCSECGYNNKNISIMRKVTSTITPYDLMIEEGQEDLFNAQDIGKKVVFLANSRAEFFMNVDRDDSNFEKDIPNKEDAIKAFEDKYINFINLLDAKSIQYSIKFGVVSYYW